MSSTPFLFPPSPPSLSKQNLSRAFGSLICQQLAPGGTRSREMRSLEAERCVWRAAAARLLQVLPDSRLCRLEGPSLEPGPCSGDSRGGLSCQICYLLPAPHPRTNCTPVPPGQVRKPQGNSGLRRPRKHGSARTLASQVLPLPCQQPPRAVPPPGPAWVQYHSPHGADSGRAATPPPPPPRPVAIYREASPKAAAEAAGQGQPRETFSELTQLRR